MYCIEIPGISQIRATLVSVNLFSLLCDGTDAVSTSSLLSIRKYGGPIIYLIVYAFVLLGILVWVDSGSRYPRPLRRKKSPMHRRLMSTSSLNFNDDFDVQRPDNDLLRIVGVSKAFNGKLVADDINLNIPRDTIFTLLGPNGAGKTTTFKIIRGDVVPDTGDVFIDGHSIVTNPRLARMSLGVCPQFTAVDDQLTVREHLIIYGRLKGLDRGAELDTSIKAVLDGTSLTMYADRLASKLSGGNQRKLSLAIALLGNPPVILIDEFSTGVDPKMKRDMWQTLRRVAIGKAIVITTRKHFRVAGLTYIDPKNCQILWKRLPHLPPMWVYCQKKSWRLALPPRWHHATARTKCNLYAGAARKLSKLAILCLIFLGLAWRTMWRLDSRFPFHQVPARTVLRSSSARCPSIAISWNIPLRGDHWRACF